MIPYEVQPTRSLIGRFTQPQPLQESQPAATQLALQGASSKMDEDEEEEKKDEKQRRFEEVIEQARIYERRQETARQLGTMEENYYQD